MMLLLALLPLSLAFALILSGRASIAGAGGLGALAALALVVVDHDLLTAFDAAARGLWVAWQAISIILAGLFFQKAALAASPDVFAAPQTSAGNDRSRAFTAVFLLGVFVESASGFGLGAVAAAAVLQASGLASIRAAALALLSLALVPWGALAIGTGIAAGLTGIPVAAIGVESALLSIPILAVALVLFWRWAPAATSPFVLLAEALWLGMLLALLWAANAFGAVDVAGVIAAGALFALRWAMDRARGLPALSAAPFAMFAILIVALRLAPGVTPALGDLWSIQPWPDLPQFPPLAHASLWLVLGGAAYAAWKGLSAWRITAEAKTALKAARIPSAVTAGYVILGEGMATTGAPAAIAGGVASLAGEAGGYITPVFAAVAGWLTGSNAAAHGMLVDLQAAIGQAAGSEPLTAVTAQNVVASAFTMLSPMRVALVAAALGLMGQETAIVRRLLPFALAVIAVGWGAIAVG
jgi:lactate permease